ncbi:MAG: hypothetical protein ABI835_20150, partial [Chloroflexota bacterium]
MMIRHAVRHALYVGIVAMILTLSGVFVSFASREVIAGGLTLSSVTLIMMLGGGALLAGSSARRHKGRTAAVCGSSILGALIVGGLLAALVLVEASIDLRFVFANLTQPIGQTLKFGQETLPGLLTLLAIAAVIGAVVAVLLSISANARRVILLGLGMTVVVGLLEGQIASVMTLPDALALAGVFALGYAAGTLFKAQGWLVRLLISAVPGIVVGVILALLANGGGLDAGGILRGAGSMPVILAVARGNSLLPLALIFAVIGVIGGTAASASGSFHNSLIFFIVTLVVIGVLNAQNAMTITAAVVVVAIYIAAFALVPLLGKRVEVR